VDDVGLVALFESTDGFAAVIELFGEIATTSAGSVATAAVEAAFTATVFVPSVIFSKRARAAASPVGIVLVPSVTLTGHPSDRAAAVLWLTG
jgi:hypothetical protein